MTRRRRQPAPAHRLSDREVAEVAATLRGLVDAVSRGELVAPPGLTARLEGAATALELVGRASYGS